MKSQVISVNISDIKTVEWKGKEVTTGIFKQPSEEKLKVEGVNIEGDDQADRRVHGGEYKAVYAYPIEHYGYWKEIYPDLEFHHGMFGENLTTEGLIEEELWIGDILEIGTSKLMVVQPRQPCFKLGIKFGTQQVVKQFARSGKSGYYLKIVEEGELQTGDTIVYKQNSDPKITISDLLRIHDGEYDQEILEKAASEENLPPRIRNSLRELYVKLYS